MKIELKIELRLERGSRHHDRVWFWKMDIIQIAMLFWKVFVVFERFFGFLPRHRWCFEIIILRVGQFNEASSSEIVVVWELWDWHCLRALSLTLFEGIRVPVLPCCCPFWMSEIVRKVLRQCMCECILPGARVSTYSKGFKAESSCVMSPQWFISTWLWHLHLIFSR